MRAGVLGAGMVERRNNEDSFVSLVLCFREPSLMDEAFADRADTTPLHYI